MQYGDLDKTKVLKIERDSKSGVRKPNSKSDVRKPNSKSVLKSVISIRLILHIGQTG
jgi:hypothetical protein